MARWDGRGHGRPTPDHSLLKTNLGRVVGNALSGRGCRAFDSDLRVRCPATGLATYPDLTVGCGPFVIDDEDKDAAVNPTVIFELLSKSTASYDRTEKFDHYATLEMLATYVIVDNARPRIDVYTRPDEDSWVRRRYASGARVPLPAIGAEIAVDDIYDGWAELRARLAEEAERVNG
ncbi:MAG: Uma2 family endonuclease [Myxococcales bacterium]|nr:Uma2 family endonuclease [Myxococcales bacterium]